MISEFKPGIYPGRFVIPACLDFKKPKTLVVTTSVYFIPQFNGDEEMPSHVVKVHCKEMVESIFNDYMRSQMDVNVDCRPGLDFVPGRVSVEEFLKSFPLKHIEMQKKQLTWFTKLVQRADNDWNRYKNHKVVSDNQRFAARALGLEKDWLTLDSTEVPVKCPSCKTNCVPDAVVCANCRCILDKEKYDKLSFAA
jgi:hypothetical protein